MLLNDRMSTNGTPTNSIPQDDTRPNIGNDLETNEIH